MSPLRRFAFRLCLAIGCPHPRRLVEEPWSVTGDELLEWSDFYNLEPFGDLRADLRIGILTAELTNRWRGKTEAAQTPQDFMPFLQHDATQEEPMSESQIDAALMRFLS